MISADGIGLLCGVLEDFAKRGADCPKVVAATHFHGTMVRDILPVAGRMLIFFPKKSSHMSC